MRHQPDPSVPPLGLHVKIDSCSVQLCVNFSCWKSIKEITFIKLETAFLSSAIPHPEGKASESQPTLKDARGGCL